MSDENKGNKDGDGNKPSSKEDFNRVSWRMYSIVTSIPISMIFAAVSYGQYMKDGSGLWMAGAIAGALATIGGVAEAVRCIRNESKSVPDLKNIDLKDDAWDDDDDWPDNSPSPKP